MWNQTTSRRAGMQDSTELPSLQPPQPARRSGRATRKRQKQQAVNDNYRQFDRHTAEMRAHSSSYSRDRRQGTAEPDLEEKRRANPRGAIMPPNYEEVQQPDGLAQHASEQDQIWQTTRPSGMTGSHVAKQQPSVQPSHREYREKQIVLEHADEEDLPEPPQPIRTNRVADFPPPAAAFADTSATPDPQQQRPGAYAVPGPGFDDSHTVSDWTVQIGGDDNDNSNIPPPIQDDDMTALDATIVDSQRDAGEEQPPHEEELPPLVEAQVDKSCTFRDRRVQIIIGIVLVALIGAVLGIVFGVAVDSGGGNNDTPAPTPTAGTAPPTMVGTLAPTISNMPSSSPTFLSTLDSGSISVTVGGLPSVPMAYSRDGTRLALVDSTNTATVYEEQQSGNWVPLGNAISGAASATLAGNRIAVGSTGTGASVSVLELVDNVWTRVGPAIDSAEGWNVALSQDGNVVAVESTSQAQVYSFNDGTNDWVSRGNAITISSSRTSAGNAFNRMAMDDSGNTLVVDLSVYQFDAEQNDWLGQALQGISSDPPDTPVSISGNGLVVAVGQPQSNINGVNSGVVRVFGFNNNNWNPLGDSIIGDGQVRGFWGFSHALSQDGSRIVAMNNPDGGSNQAFLYRLEGSSWTRIFVDSLPTAFNDGAVGISADGSRVAVAGQTTIQFYTVAGNAA